MIGGKAIEYNSRFDHKNKHYRELIQSIQKAGVRIGIHPSFYSLEDTSLIKKEKEQLEEIIDQEVTYSRQHFLKYRLPTTYRALIEYGIQHEYTGGYYSKLGFKYGITVPFYWFDLEKNEKTTLQLHPVMVMDQTVVKYMVLSHQEGYEEIQHYVQWVKRYGGTFSVLLHNETFSETEQWVGWGEVFVRFIEELKT